jgi:hypothetical protein
MRRNTLAFAFVALLACGPASAAETPDALIGQYGSAAHKVCVASGRSGKPTCSRIADTMTIRPTGVEGGRRQVKVDAEFTLADAKICGFDGVGYWDARERRLLVADETSGCELVIEPQRRGLRAVEVRPQQCNSPCAGKTWLEGEVLRKR